jgi:cell division septum initiation protein DivIVA
VTESTETFRTVLRGYDPTEVDHRIEELAAEATTLTQQRDGLAARVEELHEATASPAEPPGYEHLGARIGQILALAETEATELRAKIQKEIEAQRETAHADVAQVREEADRYLATTRSDAEAEAARVVEDARKAADEHRDGAERAASVRMQEAEAVYEEQRARAAKAAADFETTLAGRRKAAEDEFTQKMAESQAQLDETSEYAERTRTEAETMRSQATKDAGRLVEDARETAAQIISEAKATAERIRVDTDRELAAATQRRDSINSQLANVRQMLATLTGTAPFSLTGFADADEAWAETASEHADTDETDDTDDTDDQGAEAAPPETDEGEPITAHDSDDDAEGDSESAEHESLAHGRS